jgi:hypothetical protein
VPSNGVFREGEPIGLVWENYDLQSSGSDVKYRVHINVSRYIGSGMENLAARVRSAFGNNVLGDANGRSNVDIEFPRTAPAKAVTVEAVTVDLGAAPAGRFRIVVEITDLVSGKKTQRNLEFETVK